MSPLPKDKVPLDFTQGVDTKSDDKLGSKPTVLENGVFGVKKSITRRPGYDLVDSLTGFGLGADGLLTALGRGFVAQDKAATYSISTANNVAKNVGRSNRWIVTKRRVVRRSTVQMNADHASVSGLVMYAWQDSDGTTTSLKYAVYEESSGVYLLPETTLTTTGWAPRVVAFTDRLAVIYGDGANLKMTYVTVSAPTTSTTATMQTNYINTTAGLLDAAVTTSGTTVVVGYSATADIRTFIANSAGTVTVAAVTVADTVDSCLRVGVFSGGNILLLWGSIATSDIRKIVYTSGLVVSSANAQYSATPATYLAILQDAANQFTIFQANNSGSAVTRVGVVSSTGSITTAVAAFLQYAVPACDPFLLNSRLIIPILTKYTNYQPTIVLVERQADGSKKVIGGLVRSAADSLLVASGGRGPRLPSVRTKTTTTGTWPILLLGEKGKLEFRSTQDVTRVGVSEFMLEADVVGFDVERNRLAPAEYGGNLYFPGAQLMQFDGVASYEYGFNLFPEFVSNPGMTGATGLSDGTYQYTLTYEFVDAQGQLQRSAPCVPVSLTVTGAPKSAAMTIRTLPFTDKTVNIVVWRTLVNGSTFYRVNPVTSPILNSTSAATASVSYTDSSTDATIATQEILNTAELEPVIPPASVFVFVHQRRLVTVQAENRRRLSISDELMDGYGPTFNEATEYDCGASEHGDVVGGGSIDDKMILFRQRGIEFVAGDGPDRSGLQNTWTAPQFITSDTGCTSAASIVQTPDGIMFKGERGIYLLNRGLQLVWIGEAVESLTGRIADAVLVPKKTQVRFSCPEAADARVLVYDYAAQQWSIFTGLQFDSMVVLGDTFYALTRAGLLWSEGDTTAGDYTTPFSLKVVTPWMKPTGIRGVQRVYRAMLLGQIEGFSTVTIDVGFDYSAEYELTMSVDTSSVAAVDEALSIRTAKLAKQQCEAIRFRITCNGTNNGVASLGASLSNLTLEVGGKRGARKLPAAQTI
jgi:hypothetical protein